MVGAATLVCALGYTRLPESLQRRPPPPPAPIKPLLPAAGPEAPVTHRAARWWHDNVALVRCPRQQAAIAVTMLLWGGYAAQLTMVPLLAAAQFGATPAHVGVIFSGVAALGLVTGPVAGRLADHFGRPRVLMAGPGPFFFTFFGFPCRRRVGPFLLVCLWSAISNNRAGSMIHGPY